MTIQEVISIFEMENALMQFDPLTGDDRPIEHQNKDNQDLYNANLFAIETLRTINWIPFTLEYDEDEKMEILQGRLPDNEQDILVTNGKEVWQDTFLNDGECYLDSGNDLADVVIAWMPLPNPPKYE